MIFGIGTDIIEIKRVAKACEKASFLNKYFTEKEIEYFKSVNFKSETLAGTFAAKEAVVKAIGTGFSGFSAFDIEILRNEKGMPYAVFNGKAKKVIEELNVKVLVTISHSKDYAVAYAVAEER